MKHNSLSILPVALLLFFTTTVAEAAANPILPPATPSTVISSPGAPPASYLAAVKTLQDNKHGENEIKSFVYQIFSLFDRHAEVNNVLLLFADEDLYMRVPEGPIDSHQEFEKWYAGIGAKYQSNLHAIERLDVKTPSKGNYQVDLIVTWQALDRQGKYTTLRSRQQWQIVDGGGYWPRITRYVVEPLR